MKFGVFFEISVPRPWGPETEYTVYQNCLEQARLADELGFDQAWAVEHHFLEEYSHSSAPEIFLTAIAMQTKQIRVGHGIVTCVPELNSPIRAAERGAVLDLVSGGRLEFGTGRSATWTELGGFGADPDETKKTWDEYVRVIPKMWTQERFSYQGRAFSMPERSVLPKPYQKPHPPMWVAVTSVGTEIDAAERGLGSLGLSFGGVGEQAQKIAGYRKRIQSCDPVGEFVNEQVNTVSFLYCHEDGEQGHSHGPADGGDVQLPVRADAGDAAGVPDAVVPLAGAALPAAAGVDERPRRARCRRGSRSATPIGWGRRCAAGRRRAWTASTSC